MAMNRVPNVTIPEIDAFIFENRYLVDNKFSEQMDQCTILDGDQQDRFYISEHMKNAFPRIDVIVKAADDPSKKKYLPVIDFAYYVLHENVFQPGSIVVPINKQMTDIRAANLILMPGTNRRSYRSTDIIPRDGLSLGKTEFLPRSVTICKDTHSERYKFMTSLSGKVRKGSSLFDREDAARVYEAEVVVLLKKNDKDFNANNVLYQVRFETRNIFFYKKTKKISQGLCKSYLIAFPPHQNESETRPESGKSTNQDDDKKRKAPVVIEAREISCAKICNSCGKMKKLDQFETRFGNCMDCV